MVVCPPALAGETDLAAKVESSNKTFFSVAARVVALHRALATPSKVRHQQSTCIQYST